MTTATKTPLKIMMFENAGGSISFRVTGTIHGELIQKNFPTDAEVRTFMNGLLAAAGQGESSPQRLANTIFPTDAELHEAELAWQRLRAQVLKGSLVTAITDTCARPPAQSHRPLAIDQTSFARRCGHTNYSAQRNANRYLRRATSSPKRFSSSMMVLGKSSAMVEIPTGCGWVSHVNS